MEKDRKQINIRVSDELLAAIDDIRRASRPIPTVTDAIAAAVMDYRARLVRTRQNREQKAAAG